MTRETVIPDLLLHCHNEIIFSFESTVDAYIPNSYTLLRLTAWWVVFFSMTRETVLFDLLLQCHNKITFSFESTVDAYNPNSYTLLRLTPHGWYFSV
jgi:hypothetical protein